MGMFENDCDAGNIGFARHALERTSAKGGPFVGRCMSCGKENLTLTDMARQYCDGNLSQEDALLRAVKG